MAGVQIDGVNNKIDFDDDLDTSISANTDDQLVFEAGGTEIVEFNATGVIIRDGTTITTADNTDTLSLTSTDADSSQGPNLRLYRNSSSPAGSDLIGTIDFEGRNNNSEDVVYAKIKSEISAVADGNEYGVLSFESMRNGTLTTAMQIGSGINISVADNADNLTLISTDADDAIGPNLRLYRNSGSPADADNLGTIDFEGRNDNSQDVVYAQFLTQADDVSDGNEDGIISLKAMTNGTSRELLRLSGNGGAVFNELSQDIDFRVESNGDVNRFVVDGGTDTVLFGTATADTVGGDVVANQIFGTGAATGALSIVRGVASTASGSLVFGKTRNTTYGSRTVVQSGDRLGNIIFHGDDGSDLNSQGAIIAAEVDGTPGNNDMPGRLIFLTTPDSAASAIERMRIRNNGRVNIGDVTNSHDGVFTATQTTAGDGYALFGRHSASSGTVRLLRGSFSEQAPDNSTSVFITMGDSSATRFNVNSDGDVTNHDNAYGQISDERIKTNITDANSQWADIKAIKVKNFERKDDVTQYGEGKKVQIGVVAQEVETVSPGLIKEGEPTIDDIKMSSAFGTLYTSDDAETKDGNDAVLYTAEDQEVIDGAYNVGDVKTEATHSKKIGDIKSLSGEKVKQVSYSVLYMKAIKALQEAQTRIETLETKVAALEG